MRENKNTGATLFRSVVYTGKSVLVKSLAGLQELQPGGPTNTAELKRTGCSWDPGIKTSPGP